ncbi:MAG: aminopeptidase N [Nocardioides sp.]
MSPHTNPSGPPRSLRHTEAVERAALLDVTAYDVTLDLDRGHETFSSSTVIDLVSQGGPTFLDVQPVNLRSVTVNGSPVDVGLLERGRLPITTEAGENRVVVDAEMRYRNDGEGLHRAVDPADGRHYVYAMTFLDAAPSIFGCFDQPDIKSRWTLHVRAPQDWTVIGNSPATQVEPGRWELSATLPLPTYLVALVAGPYHVIRSEHDGMPLGLSVRASMARHLDHDAPELFTVTGQCFDEFHRLFGMRYPFGDYHQAFVPEFNAGAMESAACVTFRDEYIFESQSVRSQHIFRANVVAHEMAHMWFGDIVTPVWWDDLWLNESFAEYMGARVTADATEFSDAWLHDAYSRHQWGLTADQRPSTHPVAGNGASDSSVALQNFDGISYAKGAVVIKQLNSRVGDEVFFGGVADHFQRHEYGNATMADLVESWERAGAGDLSAFRDGWLLTAGPDRLELDRAAGVVRRTSLEGHPAQREHALTIASSDEPGGAWRFDRLLVDADEVPVAVGAGPVVIDPYFETWAVTTLDPTTLAGLARALPATDDALVRASAWNSLHNAFYHAEVDPAVVLDLVEATMADEDTDDGVAFTLSWASGAVAPLAADPEAALARIHDVAARRTGTAPDGSTLQLAAFRTQVSASRSVGDLRGWLGADTLPPGLELDLEMRWRILYRLAVAGDAGRDELATALADEPTAISQVWHARSSAAIPDAEAKAWAWQRFTGEVDAPNHELDAIGTGLWQLGQEELTDPYVARYFADVPGTAEVRSVQMLASAASIFYPALAVSAETIALAETLLADPELHSTLHREVVDQTSDLEHRLAILTKYGTR